MLRRSFHFPLGFYPKAMGTPSTHVWIQPRSVDKRTRTILLQYSWQFFTQMVGCDGGFPYLRGLVESIPNIHKNNFKTCLTAGLSFLPDSLFLLLNSWLLGKPRTWLDSAFGRTLRYFPTSLFCFCPRLSVQQQIGSSQHPCPYTTILSVSNEIIYSLIETIFWLQVIFNKT